MTARTEPIKIWYQSFVDPAEQAPYFRELGKLLAATGGAGVTFELKGIVAVTAQHEGYDAFVIGHFQDGWLYEARAFKRFINQFCDEVQPLVDQGPPRKPCKNSSLPCHKRRIRASGRGPEPAGGVANGRPSARSGRGELA